MRTEVAAAVTAAPGPAAGPGPAAVTVTDLRKSYGAVAAVRGVSFTVARGEIFALIGPNGRPRRQPRHWIEAMEQIQRDGLY